MDIKKALEEIKAKVGEDVFKLISGEVAKVETLTKERDDFKTSNIKLGEDLKTRETEIGTLKVNAQKQGENFKKLRDMTEAEKELLSEAEKNLMMRTEKFEEEQKKDREARDARDKKTRETTINNLATKMAKGNKELVEQIKINLGKLNPELINGALTEEELTPHVDAAFKMTGAGINANPLRDAHNAEGQGAPIKRDNDFSETKEGKDLGAALGLSFVKPEAQAGGGEGGGEKK